MKRTTVPPIKMVGRICWIVVIVIAAVWMISQQFIINKYSDELTRLEDESADLKDRIDELSTMTELSEKDFEKAAREQGYVRPDEVIIKEAE